jgi:hypothetical protein
VAPKRGVLGQTRADIIGIIAHWAGCTYDPVLRVYFMALRIVAAALFLPLGKQCLSDGQALGAGWVSSSWRGKSNPESREANLGTRALDLPRSASAAATLSARILNSDRQIGRCMELNTPNRWINLARTGALSRNRGARREWRNG